MEETWKDIIDYEGLYQISSYGNVKSLPKEWFCNNGRRFHNGKIMKPFPNPQGYKIIELCKNGIKLSISIHRLIAIHYIENCENKPEVNHKNGDKKDNRIENLEWVTSAENTIHAYGLGLKISPKGEQCGKSKLANDDIKSIRELYSMGCYSQPLLAKMFLVNQSTIERIINRKTWAHI